MDLGAGHEARAEGAVPALLEQAVVADQVLGVVGGVGHHDRHRVALEDVEPGADRHCRSRVRSGSGGQRTRGLRVADRRDHRVGASRCCRR